ncbi:MAG: nickel pincer cofactor biosynthesis protein LarB [Candidatus Sumerlaeia bacterium]|nr:nickel pincer cofactor biosynthesis protein LarB [Candidatus Sumerlaeia bacterium]
MDPRENPTPRAILEALSRGEVTVAQAEEALAASQIGHLGHTALDLQREARRGRPEVIYGAGKTPTQLVEIAGAMLDAGQNVIVTRLKPEGMAALMADFPAEKITDNPTCGFLHLGKSPPRKRGGLVVVLAAGTSDLPVAEEAALTARALGSPVETAWDVGVAGLHRLLSRGDLLRRARVIVAVAGMEGALPGVVSGLVRAPVIAVPTSVGYGAGFQGLSALLTMINGCSPGVSVVNIDNGFGAGYLADIINELGDGDVPHQ